MKAWGSEKLHLGVAPWHARISALERFAFVIGRTGLKGHSIWVLGIAYDQEERTLLVGIPGIAFAVVA